MATQKVRSFMVVGRTEFPIDMLRYDACWPATESDSGVIEMTRHGASAVLHVVEVRTYQAALTGDRWKSFGWEVRG